MTSPGGVSVWNDKGNRQAYNARIAPEAPPKWQIVRQGVEHRAHVVCGLHWVSRFLEEEPPAFCSGR